NDIHLWFSNRSVLIMPCSPPSPGERMPVLGQLSPTGTRSVVLPDPSPFHTVRASTTITTVARSTSATASSVPTGLRRGGRGTCRISPGGGTGDIAGCDPGPTGPGTGVCGDDSAMGAA